MATQLAARPAAADDEYACQCGLTYPSGISYCPRCSRPTPGVTPDYQLSTTVRRVRGIRLAFGVIGLNIVWQIVTAVAVLGGHMEPHKAAGFVIWGGVAFYAVVLMVITGPLMLLKPAWLKGDRQTAAVLGVEVGLAAAAFLIILFWVSSGHPILDQGANLLVSEGSIVRTILAFFLIAMVAPVVEELLFRGVVAESLRKNNAPVALGVSSFLFALAHLHSLRYYTICGLVLGILYWHRGLWASIAAHATFNGSLVVLAVVVALGPARTVSNGGVSLRAHTDWQVNSVLQDHGATVALRGPSGSYFAVVRNSLPDGRSPNLDRLASALNSGGVPMPDGWKVTPSSAKVVTYPTGRGVQIGVTVHGHAGVVAVIPRGNVLWEVDFATGGSGRAEREYPSIMNSLSLPRTA
ncbi:MAG: CPBP family intramembrane metalloprotease [Actinobacteria bacterium]|nr:CPBP family intramembrane metalloprotease [Actinomycetota bacterium]MBV9664580.1 CPBP family intramembrane metalloprotease [Actinomycetota bacterium]MBV9935159.1 CPBP family intramembrane metalloprotease [Actinomycetota bacterium]